MDYSNKIKTAIKFLGYNLNDVRPKMNIKIISFYVLKVILSVTCIDYLTNNWYDIDKRINSLKTMVLFMGLLTFSLICFICWNDFKSNVSLTINGNIENFPFIITENRINLTEINKKGLISNHNLLHYFIILYVIAAGVLPLFGTIFMILTTENINIERLPLLYPVIYPKNYKNIYIYFIWYVLQTIYIASGAAYVYLTNTVPILSMQVVANDIKLLCLSIEEINNCVISYEQNNNNKEKNNSTTKNCYFCYEEIKIYMRYIITYHQLIYRKIDTVNKGIEGISLALKCGACSYCCMSIYYVIQKDDVVSKLTEATLCMVILYLIYVFDVSGERVMTEWENLRSALYGCHWISKPNWFKKVLLIIMTRNNKPIEIKPFGLMVLNLKNFAASINIIYSYYNLLNKLKR